MPPIILASASPRRADLLRVLKVDFEVLPSQAVEVAHEHLTPLEVCQLNAHRKARAIAKKIPDRLVLGADTLVFWTMKFWANRGIWPRPRKCCRGCKAAPIRW